ncbi:MAG: hypothetical protein AAGG68_20680 [Bacteroidota bacterium]
MKRSPYYAVVAILCGVSLIVVTYSVLPHMKDTLMIQPSDSFEHHKEGFREVLEQREEDEEEESWWPF